MEKTWACWVSIGRSSDLYREVEKRKSGRGGNHVFKEQFILALKRISRKDGTTWKTHVNLESADYGLSSHRFIEIGRFFGEKGLFFEGRAGLMKQIHVWQTLEHTAKIQLFELCKIRTFLPTYLDMKIYECAVL